MRIIYLILICFSVFLAILQQNSIHFLLFTVNVGSIEIPNTVYLIFAMFPFCHFCNSFIVYQVLKRLGYSKVILQIGRGKIEPQQINQPDFCLEAYRYKDSIAEDIYNADLVISHAGTGIDTNTNLVWGILKVYQSLKNILVCVLGFPCGYSIYIALKVIQVFVWGHEFGSNEHTGSTCNFTIFNDRCRGWNRV